MAMNQSPEARLETGAERNVVALFARQDQVVEAVRRLHGLGLPTERISLLAKDQDALREAASSAGAGVGTDFQAPDSLADDVAPKGRDELTGMAIGGGVGLVLGLSAIAIPGFGPFLLAAGPVAIAAHALTTAAAGLGLGALVGAILDEKVTEDHRELYTRRLEAGNWMLVVHAEAHEADQAIRVLKEQGAEHLDTF